VEIVEVDELSALAADVAETDIARRVEEFHSAFDVQADCPSEELQRAARTSVALDAFVARYDLDALAYYYKGSGNAANEDTMSSIILGTSLLTARHIPVAGEYEVKNALAMKMMDCLGTGGSFTEYYAMDFNDDLVLMGHDGPGHIAISQGKTKVRPLTVYHGKVGRGLSVEMSVKHGPVTLLSVVEDAEKASSCWLPRASAWLGRFSRLAIPIAAIDFRWGREDLLPRGMRRDRRTTAPWAWAMWLHSAQNRGADGNWFPPGLLICLLKLIR
jgi:L-arabinose isomerase